MSIEQFEKDVATVTTEIEQASANLNVLIGQKQALVHVIDKLKQGAQTIETVAATVEKVADVVEQVVDTSPATAN